MTNPILELSNINVFYGAIQALRDVSLRVDAGEIIVEIKAKSKLTGGDEGQLINYLKATGKRVGVLINFGSDGKLEWLRRVK